MKTKRLILVTSPPASGKTYISKKISEKLKNIVYLDKDTLIPLSKQIFAVAGEEYNRSSDFFEKHIRDYEYTTIVDLALEALNYDDKALINAPFTREIRSPEYMNALKARLKDYNAKLTVIWVITRPEIIHQRMIERNSDRDTWKLENWDQYISEVDFSIPSAIDDKNDDLDFLEFYNSSEEEYTESMERIVSLLENE
ncbi:adenylate kinase family enzyme [Chryseobacterium defluvii]|uniref:Adenylate kinase family enzyme n=1 Tax=Chryseobacterium defluvii TaxID=160396 RepID=A0A840KBR4_9FLAO|nr:AAA family ATPase [Chryseobacterium defluvii]MBB4805020.1 adenylate kinase family enzyme [Chryseobacterium defluvii]